MLQWQGLPNVGRVGVPACSVAFQQELLQGVLHLIGGCHLSATAPDSSTAVPGTPDGWRKGYLLFWEPYLKSFDNVTAYDG